MKKDETSTGKGSGICILITTYNRPELLLDLLNDCTFIDGVKVKVYDDGSTDDYSRCKKLIMGMGWTYKKVHHHGKYKFYQLHQLMYNEMRGEKYKYFIQLLDDMRLIDGFQEKVIKQFNDSGADLLNIINMDVLVRVMQERGVKMRTVDGVGYWDYHWLDLCFITTEDYFKQLNYTCPNISDAWFNRKKYVSSGVSTALTKAYKGKISIVDRSLLIHMGHISKMNTYKQPYLSRL